MLSAPMAFILSALGLFIDGRKWPAIAGLVLSALFGAGIVTAVVVAAVCH